MNRSEKAFFDLATFTDDCFFQSASIGRSKRHRQRSAAEFYPAVTAGFGAAFGVGTATLLDEAAVPLVGLGQAPWKAGPTSNLYSYASHLVFGSATELVRRQVAGTLKA